MTDYRVIRSWLVWLKIKDGDEHADRMRLPVLPGLMGLPWLCLSYPSWIGSCGKPRCWIGRSFLVVLGMLLVSSSWQPS